MHTQQLGSRKAVAEKGTRPLCHDEVCAMQKKALMVLGWCGAEQTGTLAE